MISSKTMIARIFEIKRFAVHDGPGIRTTVFFKGCPLRCVWCHNPEGLKTDPELAFYEGRCVSCGKCVSECPEKAHIMKRGRHVFLKDRCVSCGICERTCPQQALRLYGREMSLSEVMEVLMEDRDFYENTGGGVTLSGGECLLQIEFVSALLHELKKSGIHTAIDTCGCVPKAYFEQILNDTDLFLYDIKAISEACHRHCTGVSNKLILENLNVLDRSGKDIEIRVPYVPGFNDGEMLWIAEYLQGLTHLKGIRILPYHDFARSKYRALQMNDTLPQKRPDEDETRAVEKMFETFGLPILS